MFEDLLESGSQRLAMTTVVSLGEIAFCATTITLLSRKNKIDTNFLLPETPAQRLRVWLALS